MSFTVVLLIGVAIGIVVKTLIPIMPLDDPIRRGWAWLWSKVAG